MNCIKMYYFTLQLMKRSINSTTQHFKRQIFTFRSSLVSMPTATCYCHGVFCSIFYFLSPQLIYSGGFSPLSGFMEEGDYKSVVDNLKLSNGLIFGLPVVYDTDDDRVVPGAKVLLQYKNVPIAVFHVSTYNSHCCTLLSLHFPF